MRADLHTHSTASDGKLTPVELVQTAADAGVEMLAITDHDTLAGLDQLLSTLPDGLQLIPGIELSANWRNIGIHIVGLNVDRNDSGLNAACESQTDVRQKRAVVIAERLEKAGFTNVLEGTREIAAGSQIGRPHFAQYLVNSGQIADISTAFKRHLGRGKRGDVRQGWPDLATVINWIGASGGVAVLAHPAKYKLTNLRLEELCRDFAAAGGGAIEVISGLQEPAVTEKLGRLANRHGLLASAGSDFHQPGQRWARLGDVQPLPSDCRPVWQHW